MRATEYRLRAGERATPAISHMRAAMCAVCGRDERVRVGRARVVYWGNRRDVAVVVMAMVMVMVVVVVVMVARLLVLVLLVSLVLLVLLLVLLLLVVVGVV